MFTKGSYIHFEWSIACPVLIFVGRSACKTNVRKSGYEETTETRKRKRNEEVTASIKEPMSYEADMTPMQKENVSDSDTSIQETISKSKRHKSNNGSN